MNTNAHVSPTLLSYGKPRPVTEILRAECWHLFNPRTGQKVSLANCAANLCTLHAYLKASWTLTNDDESLAGYVEPAATRSQNTDGRAATDDDLRTENEGNK